MVTPQVKRFTLRCADGGRLPAWSAGSHIGVTLTDGHPDVAQLLLA